jgi:hypothetical protein
MQLKHQEYRTKNTESHMREKQSCLQRQDCQNYIRLLCRNVKSRESMKWYISFPNPAKLSLKINGKLKTFQDKHKLTQCISTALQKILKRILHTDDEER